MSTETEKALLAHAGAQTALLQVLAFYFAASHQRDSVREVPPRILAELDSVSPAAAEQFRRMISQPTKVTP